MRATPFSFATILAMAFLIGCGEDSPSDETDTGSEEDAGSSEDTGAGDDTGTDTPDGSGEESDADTPSRCSRINTINGAVESASMDSVEQVYVQICVRGSNDALACLRPESVDASGEFSISVPSSQETICSMVARVYDASAVHATTYCPITLGRGAGDFTLPSNLRVFDVSAADSIAISEGIGTAEFEGMLTLSATIDDVEDGEESWNSLAAAEVSTDASGLCFVGDDMPDRLFALSPDKFVRSYMSASIVNDTDLEPGSTAEVFVLGSVYTPLQEEGEELHEGEWVSFATATLNDDATAWEIESGLPAINWFGIRYND